MPDPASLPTELFSIILDNIQLSSSERQCETDAYFECDIWRIKQLFACSVVNKTWHVAAIPRLYSVFAYDGEKTSSRKLLQFMCCVIENPAKARLVRRLSFAYLEEDEDDPWADPESESWRKFSTNTMKTVLDASNWADLSMSPVDFRRYYDHQRLSFIPLLLHHLPNLTCLDARVDHLGYDFQHIQTLLKRASAGEQGQRPNVLQNVAELTLGYLTLDSYLILHHLLDVFRLPSLQKLTISGLDGTSEISKDELAPLLRKSSVTDLSILCARDDSLSASVTKSVLSLPKTLTSLSLYFSNRDYGDHPADPENTLSNSELSSVLMSHYCTLKYLDVYRQGNKTPPIHGNRDNSHMSLLTTFTELKNLKIQPEVLLGGCCGCERAPFCLEDTLPSTLHSLTLYGDEGLALDQDLENQLVTVVRLVKFEGLKFLTLEDMHGFSDHHKDPSIDLSRETLKEACAKEKVELQFAEPRSLRPGRFCRASLEVQRNSYWRRHEGI